MLSRHRLAHSVLAAVLLCALALVGQSLASAPPVGPLPPGPTSTIRSSKGELVAVALPHRPGGRVWRIARPFDSAVVRQVAEADVGTRVVVVFRAIGRGTTTIVLALTRGEGTKAFASRRYVVTVTG